MTTTSIPHRHDTAAGSSPQTWNSCDINLGDQSYAYHFGFDCLGRIGEEFGKFRADRFFVVTDDTVLALHGEELIAGLQRHAPVHVLSLPPGEGMKSLSTLSRYLDCAIAEGATRRSVVVAFGGGVPGNLGGTMAGLLFRGIRLVHVPTTTVAAMDSVLSFKQAINSGHGKNHIGVYHAPEAVYLDIQVLQTLPPRELRSGLCEALKNCIAIRPGVVPDMLAMLTSGDLTSPASLQWLLQESLTAKSEVMRRDAREQRAGLILEYGHTVGHAVELCDQRLRGSEGISHGDAVALGMAAAARVSAACGWLDASAVSMHDELIKRLGAPTRIPDGLSTDDIMALIRADNKRGYLDLAADEAALVLLRDFGVPLGTPDCPLVPVPMSVVHEVVLELRGPL